MKGLIRAVVILAVRWSGLLMAAGLALAGLWTESAVAMLVALAQVLAWRSRLPWRWEVAISATSMVAAVSSYFLLYERVWGWDLLVHFALTGLLAVMAARIVARGRPGPALIIGSGTALALVWEVMEQLAHDHIDQAIYVAAWDTVGDIIAGIAGSIVAAGLYARQRDPYVD